MTPLRLGLVGFGRLARQYYVPALHRLRNVGEILIADPLESSRAAAGLAFPAARIFSDPLEVIGCRPDGLLVASPPSTHLPLWAAAARARVPVLLEKPFLLRGELADAMEAGGERTLLMIDFNRRFWPPYQRIAHLVQTGAVGKIVAAELSLQVDLRPWCAVTSHRLEVGEGGALFDLGSQLVDLARWLMGREPQSVRATAESDRWPGDQVRIDLGFAGGARVRCRLGYADRTFERLSIEGRDGRIQMKDPNMAIRLERRGSLTVRPWNAAADLAALGYRGVFRSRSMSRYSIARAIRGFTEAIARSTPFSPGFEDAVRSATLLDAAAKSIEVGEEVDLDFAQGGAAHA